MKRSFPFPTYVLDFTTRLVAWNRRVPLLFGLPPEDSSLGGLAGKPLLALWHDPDSLPGRMLLEPEVALPAMIRRLQVPGWDRPACFRLASEPFTRDARFRMIHYFPDDLPTMELCTAWRDGAPGPPGPRMRP